MPLEICAGRSRVHASMPRFAAAVDACEPYDVELELTTAEAASRKWARMIGHPVVENGRVVRVRGAIQDVTERHRAEEAIQRFVKGSPSIIYATRRRDRARPVGQREPRDG